MTIHSADQTTQNNIVGPTDSADGRGGWFTRETRGLVRDLTGLQTRGTSGSRIGRSIVVAKDHREVDQTEV